LNSTRSGTALAAGLSEITGSERRAAHRTFLQDEYSGTARHFSARVLKLDEALPPRLDQLTFRVGWVRI